MVKPTQSSHNCKLMGANNITVKDTVDLKKHREMNEDCLLACLH